MKKKKRRSISLSARAAIALILLSLSTLSGWRDVAIYIGAKCGNTAIITEECIKIQESAVADIYGNRSYRPLYELKLRNGTSVAIYQEETTKFFSSAEELEQCFVTGQSITFTYVRKPAFRDNVFALISAVCGEEELYPISVGIAPFWQRTRTFIIVDSIILGVASLLLIVPPLRAAIRKRKSRLKKEQRKQARREKLRSGNGQ